MTNYYDPGTGDFVALDGMIVERDALRIAEAIRDYDPNLVLLCLDPDRAEGISDAPFIVAECCPDGVLRPVFRAWELNDLILERIRLADTCGFLTYEKFLRDEQKVKDEKLRRYGEWREEVKDVVSHIAGMKSKYTVRDSQTGDMLVFYDDRPAERK